MTPTASTMVSASTISTALARNTAVTSTRRPRVGAAVGRGVPTGDGSGGLDELVELLERVDLEHPVEDQELEHPEDPEGEQVGHQHHEPSARGGVRWWTLPMCRAKAAPPMEKAMPMADSDQKGMISLIRWERPPLPQTHVRLSQ